MYTDQIYKLRTSFAVSWIKYRIYHGYNVINLSVITLDKDDPLSTIGRDLTIAFNSFVEVAFSESDVCNQIWGY